MLKERELIPKEVCVEDVKPDRYKFISEIRHGNRTVVVRDLVNDTKKTSPSTFMCAKDFNAEARTIHMQV